MAMSSQTSIIPAFREMKHQTMAKMTTVSALSHALVLAIMGVVAYVVQ
jgi:hypothetical protein